MTKWSGKSGGLILVNELKKIGVKDVEAMTAEERFKLLNYLTQDYLATFLGSSRFMMARAELISILGLSDDAYQINERSKSVPRSPNLLGKPQV